MPVPPMPVREIREEHDLLTHAVSRLEERAALLIGACSPALIPPCPDQCGNDGACTQMRTELGAAVQDLRFRINRITAQLEDAAARLQL